MGKTKKALLLTSLVGAGLLWLSTTKKGKEVRGQALEYAEEVYGEVRKQVLASKTWDKMTKTKFAALVAEVVDEYSKKEGIGANVKKMIEKIVATQWENLQAEAQKVSASKKGKK